MRYQEGRVASSSSLKIVVFMGNVFHCAAQNMTCLLVCFAMVFIFIVRYPLVEVGHLLLRQEIKD